MSTHSTIDNSIVARLQERANQLNISVNELLAGWLDTNANTQQVVNDRQSNVEEILNQISDYVWTAEIVNQNDFRYVYYSPVVEAITGYPPEYFLSGLDAWLRIIHPDDLPMIREEIEQELYGMNVEHEYRIIRADGKIRWLWGTTTPTLNDMGQVVRLDGVVSDITDRKQAEIALKVSENRYRTLFNSALNPILMFDADARIVLLNEMAASNFNATVEEVTGKLLGDFFPDGQQLMQERVQTVLATGEAIFVEDTPILNGEQRWLWSSMQPVLDDMGRPKQVLMISYDITERQQAHEAQQRIEERYYAALEASLDGFYLLESVYDDDQELSDFKIVDINDSAVKQLGLSRKTLIGGLICELLPLTRTMGFFDTYKQVFETGKPHIEEFFIPEEGYKSGWYRHQVVRVGDGIAIMTRNITEWKENEHLSRDNERIKAQVQREQERNVLTQHLISMLSHDLRTPLTIVATTHEILYRYYERLTEQQRQEKIETIDRQIQFAINLLQDTVDVVRGSMDQKLSRRWVNLGSLCRISLEEIAQAYGQSYNFEFINRGNVQMSFTDETLVSRILLNLLSNAFKYTAEGGTVQLILDQADGWVKLIVTDTGMGMEENELPKIFDSFYRTDQVDAINGTGLGLSIVRDCVQYLHGRIQVESKLGTGSSFIVEFPLAIDLEYDTN